MNIIRLPASTTMTAQQALIPIHRAEPDFDMMKSAYRYADEMLKARES